MRTQSMVAEVLPKRIADKVTDTGTCWIWTGAKNSKGYGSVGIGGGTSALAHRYVYELLVATIPDGLTIDHLCMVKECVNPEHLEPVTREENAARYARTITHCVKGHELAGDNLASLTRKSGTVRRVCKTCRAQSMRDYRARNKEMAA